MKALVFLLSILNIFLFAKSIEIKDLTKKSDFEEVIFKSNKPWLVVIYANWDKNQEVWRSLWDYVKLDFERDEEVIEMGRFDVINEEDKYPDMNLLKKLKTKGLPSIVYFPKGQKNWDRVENFDTFYDTNV